MKKFFEKIKNYFMKSCEHTAEAKDVIVDKQCDDTILTEEDAVFISPILSNEDKNVDITTKECEEETKEEPVKKPKRKYKKRVKPENKQ